MVDVSSKPMLARSQEMLREEGYCVVFRAGVWTECFVMRGTERWFGVGTSEDDALEHVLAQMFPSALARMLIERHVAATLTGVNVGVAADPAAAPLARDEEDKSSGESGTTALDVTAAPPTSPPSPVPLPSPADAPLVVATATIAVSAPGAAPERKAGIAVADALAVVGAVQEEIEWALPRLARLAPDRQRQEMLVWICQARAVEEALPSSHDVTLAVARVARRLADLAKILWPGTVRALQLSTRPEDTAEPRTARGLLPNTWQQAADAARVRLDQQRDGAGAGGLDEDGWADAHVLRAPPPAGPEAFLEEIVAELSAQLGALETPADDVRIPDAPDVGALVRIAQKLRWVRGHLRDHARWGLAIGRLRRTAARLGERGGGLAEALDPRQRPAAPWAQVLSGRTEQAERAAVISELRAALPQAAGDRDALLAWLVRGIEVFTTPELAVLLQPVRDQVTALGDAAADHEDRRVRRRLRDLGARLAESGPEAVATPDEPPRSATAVKEVDGASERGLQVLGEQVRPHTQGRRVLFVSNRNDPELEAKLVELLGVRVTFCDGSLRRVQAQCERIAQGSYDLVLSATGFQLHGVDGALARSASAAKVPYVRVNRGRPLACMQAIAREFGLTAATADGVLREAASGR